MNQPDRYSRFILPEGEKKVSYKADTKLPNAGTFTFMQEDHTMGNLIRMQLHQDRQVVFAGYRVPHPLETKMVVRIQTTGEKKPQEALQHCLEDLRSEFVVLKHKFHEEFSRARSMS